jgi:hypothetical protein
MRQLAKNSPALMMRGQRIDLQALRREAGMRDVNEHPCQPCRSRAAMCNNLRVSVSQRLKTARATGSDD